MLNFIYYPVSFILWCWHKVFGFVLGDASAIGWALSIVFLVFTLRAILLKPAIKQIRSMRKMQEFAPQMKAVQKKYANDKQRQAAEMQKLQREHGVNPLGGCLPMILQIPVFIGLNHVLRSFTIYPNNPNYFFPLSDVKSYLAAKLFGAHLGDAIFNTGLIGGSAVHHNTWEWGVAPVAIPLMIIAAVATHMTARTSAKRNMSMSASGTQQSQMMQKLAMWVFPLGVLVFGGALPVGLLMYWVSNNVWTFGQQHLIFKRIAKEDEEKKRQAQEARDARAPKPGQKPTQNKKNARPAGGAVVEAAPESEKSGAQAGGKQAKPGTGNKPAPGAKPAAKKGGARNETGITNMPSGSKKNAAKQNGNAKSAGSGSANGGQSKSGQKKTNANGSGKSGTANKGGSGKAGQQKQTQGAKRETSESGNGDVPGMISDRSRKKKQKR